MCKADPGPRCSYDMDIKLKARKDAYLKAVQKFGENSPQASLAKAKILTAQLEYETTPEGLKQLKDLYEKTNNPQIHDRYLKGSVTRQMQSNAFKEVELNRPQILGQLYTLNQTFFDKEEIVSIISNTREAVETETINATLKTHQTPTITEDIPDYISFLNQLKTLATTPASRSLYERLKTLPAPDTINLQAYTKAYVAINTAKNQLLNQLQETATLQNTTLPIVQQYYEAYRDQYNSLYKNKPSKNQPNPPETWVKGEFYTAGYGKNKNSRYAPRDPASIYALYRLQNDDTAIPDYMKQNKQYIQVTQKDNNITTTTYTAEGKKIASTTKPGTPATIAELYQNLEGNILLTPGETKNNPNKLNPTAYISKHFDYPEYDNEYLSKQLNTPAEETFFTARKKAKQIWKSKPSRASAPPATPKGVTRWASSTQKTA